MSGQNVIPLEPHRREPHRREPRGARIDDGAMAMLVFLGFETMMFVGMVSAFLLTRSVAGAVWPPDGQPWFPLTESAVNTAALLASGGLVFGVGRTPPGREAWNGPLLLGAVALGAGFMLFQALAWNGALRAGLSLIPTQHGAFFCMIMALHAINTIGALVFMGILAVREVRGRSSRRAFPAARLLWYFVVGLWPVLYLSLYF